MRKKLSLLILLVAAIMIPTCVSAATTSQYITLGEATSEGEFGSVSFTAKADVAANDIKVQPVLCKDDYKCKNGTYQNIENEEQYPLGLETIKDGLVVGQTYSIGYSAEHIDVFNAITITIGNERILIGLPFGDESATMTVFKISENDEDASADELESTTVEKQKVADQTLLDMIKESQSPYQVNATDNSYTWIFDGSKMDSTDFNVNLTLAVGVSQNQKKIENLIPVGKDNPLYLHFDHHGNLPKGTSVRVRVSDKYKNGENLTLYYYNEDTGKLEEVAKSLVVKDGYVTFALEHCSDYVLASNDNSNNPQTSSINTTIYTIISLVSLIGGIICVIIIRKKKIA